MPDPKLNNALHFQIVALLERYEDHAGQLVERWLDAELYRKVSSEIEELVLQAVSLPALAASALALRIAHGELFSGLWSAAAAAPARRAVSGLVARHRACVEALRRCCVRQLQAA